MLKIIPPKNSPSYAEIGQNKQIKFACVRIKGNQAHQLHPVFLCRDFLSDVLYGEFYEQKCGIYGFSFDGTTEVWSPETQLLITYSGMSKIVNRLSILHTLETEMGISKTAVYPTEDGNKCIFVGDPAWKVSTVMLSAYTLFLRFLSYATSDTVTMEDLVNFVASGNNGNDGSYARYIKTATSRWLPFFHRWKDLHTGLTPLGLIEKIELPVSRVHNNSGIVSFFNPSIDATGKTLRERFLACIA